MKYYLIAGEASGDLHGSNLIKELKKLDKSSEFRCWGGDLILKQTNNLVKHYKDYDHMSFLEVFVNLKKVVHNLSFSKKYKADRPDSNKYLLLSATLEKESSFSSITFCQSNILCSFKKVSEFYASSCKNNHAIPVL